MSEKNSTLDIQEAEAALWRFFPVQGCIVDSGVQRQSCSVPLQRTALLFLQFGHKFAHLRNCTARSSFTLNPTAIII